MKRALSVFLLFCLAIFAAGCFDADEEDEVGTLRIINHSGSAIDEVYIYPSNNAAPQGSNWLGSGETIIDDATKDFQVDAGVYNVKIVIGVNSGIKNAISIVKDGIYTLTINP